MTILKFTIENETWKTLIPLGFQKYWDEEMSPSGVSDSCYFGVTVLGRVNRDKILICFSEAISQYH